MRFFELMQRLNDEERLFAVTLELTYACNLDCFFCYNDRARSDQPLSLEQYLALLDELYEMQVMNLVLTGGEPLAYPHFFALAGRARELGFVIRIKTNGHGLRESMVRRLKDEVDPYHLDISLHGATAATHDRQTRKPGSFERLLKNLGMLRRHGVKTKLNCTLTRWNEHEIDEIYALGDRLGLQVDFQVTVTPRDNGDRSPLEISPSRERALYLHRLRLARVAAKGSFDPASTAVEGQDSGVAEAPPSQRGGVPSKPRQCSAGVSRISVDPFGVVMPCVQWRRPVGNLHHSTMREIWKSSRGLAAAREQVSQAVDTARAMSPDGRTAGFCAGLAEAEGGSPTAEYASGRLELELRAEARRGHMIELPVTGADEPGGQ